MVIDIIGRNVWGMAQVKKLSFRITRHLVWLFLSMKGRLNRQQYWLACLGWYFAWEGFISFVSASLYFKDLSWVSYILDPVFTFFICTKRLKDLKPLAHKICRHLLILCGFIFIAYEVMEVENYIPKMSGFMEKFAMACFLFLALLGILPGAVGKNKYGPDPLAEVEK